MADKYRHTRTERRELLRRSKNIIAWKDERELMQLLRELGIKDENPRFSQIVMAFRAGKIDDLLKKKP